VILLLVAGIALLGWAGLTLSRQLFAADRERHEALGRLRPKRSQRVGVHSRELVALLAGVYVRVTRSRSLDGVQSRLERAGYAERLTAESFVALQLAAGAIGAVLGFAAGHGAGALALALVFGGTALYLPHFALSRASANRTARIERELPHFVDQLAIAIESGMSFDAALGYLLRASDGPLTAEMNRVSAEVLIGESRKRALKSLATRLRSDDISFFANAVIASEQMGTPLGTVLRTQASEIRHRHQMRTEEQAQKTPVKMLFPIAIFILPVIFVVVLGPAVLSLRNYL
jgi:tight adherence protein C